MREVKAMRRIITASSIFDAVMAAQRRKGRKGRKGKKGKKMLGFYLEWMKISQYLLLCNQHARRMEAMKSER
jgi:hypothetical protein